MRQSLLFYFACLVFSSSLFAQEVRLSGTVQDAATQQPIPGANVLIEETRQGTITDVDGNFSLNVPSGTNPTLAVSFIGYQTITQPVDLSADNNNLNFTLREDVLSLDELVVTGQGEGLSKRRLSTDVATVSSEALETGGRFSSSWT